MFVAWGIFFTDSLAAVFNAGSFNFLVPNFGWVFILATFGFLVFSFYLAFQPLRQDLAGRGRRGAGVPHRVVGSHDVQRGDGDRAMFYGVAEPLPHEFSPGRDGRAGTRAAAQVAMEYSYFHWAFHPWAIYAIVGLAWPTSASARACPT